ncbi:MAG: hypothetical protein LUH10_16845 [Tannerellaceae bacterium]|nr:hypothetical protein [Tannerellaceae bacterium]
MHLQREPDIKAEIYYLSTEEGGRKGFVSNGYRGQFYYDGRDWDAPQTFINKEICYPGETVQCYLTLLNRVSHIGKFYPGKEFEIREGAKTVGKGNILEVYTPEFLTDKGKQQESGK